MTEKLSDQLTADFLHTAILSLRQDVVPFIDNPSARIHADLITRLLYMLRSRFAHRGADLQQLLAADKAALDDIAKLLPTASTASPTATYDAHFSAIDRLEKEVLREELQIDSKLPQLIVLAKAGGNEGRAAIAALQNVVAAQKRFLAAQDPDILKGSYICYQGGRIEQERPLERPAIYGAEITEAALTQHLQSRFPGCRVEELSVMAGGFSKSTIFFTLVHASGERESLVMRKDMPVRYITNVDYEYPLLQHLHRAGFPVAEPRWLEDDPQPFGGRFMVSRRVKGSTDISRWAGDARSVEQFARQLAKTMADLHARKLDTLGYDSATAALSASEATLREIERWHHVLAQSRADREAYPLEEMALAWLQANVPPTLAARRACLTHGDIGFHNMMVDEGKVTALLDWEFSHVGDAIEDLVYTKPFIEKVMDWETFKAYYREYGGATCTPEEEFFYVVWSKTRNPINGARGATLFAEAIPDNLKFASACYVLARYLGLEAAEMVMEALAAA